MTSKLFTKIKRTEPVEYETVWTYMRDRWGWPDAPLWEPSEDSPAADLLPDEAKAQALAEAMGVHVEWIEAPAELKGEVERIGLYPIRVLERAFDRP